MRPLPVPRLLNRPPRWLGGLVAALLAFNLAAFKVGSPAAGCRGAHTTAPRACCAMRPGGCRCKKAPTHDEIPAGTTIWRAACCAPRAEAGLIHPQWEPTLLADAAPPHAVVRTMIEGGTGHLHPRGPDPPPVPPPRLS